MLLVISATVLVAADAVSVARAVMIARASVFMVSFVVRDRCRV